MTPDGVYIRIPVSTKAPHWLPNFVEDTLLLQEIPYQTYVNGVVSSLHRNKKGLWPPFPLSMRVHRIENFKKSKEEVGIFSSFIFKEVSFRMHDPQGKLKENVQQVGLVRSYYHEDLLPRELIQQQVLLKSKIPTLDQMDQIDKEVERQMSKLEKNKASMQRKNPIRVEDCEKNSSFSSMSMYILDSNGEDLDVPSTQSPTAVLHDSPLPFHMEQVHSSPITENFLSKRHYVNQEEYHLSSYNIKEIFASFTFDLHRKEVSRKRVQKVKQSDGTLEEMQEDEVLFENIDEDPVTVATSLAALIQATAHNITILNENILRTESENLKLKDEIISLREEMKRRKIEENLILLKQNILEQQEKVHDIKVECFTEIQKMEEKVKSLEKHIEIVSQINLKMESFQTKTEELEKWRNMEKGALSSLPTIKAYDIRLHTLATNECQELASMFEERARKSRARMMDVYDKSVKYVQIYLQWLEINFIDEHPIYFDFFEELEYKYEMTKVEVQAKEAISKEDIQEFLAKSSKEFSLYTVFVYKFMVGMENFKECNLTLDVNKEHIFNSREQRILTQHEAWSKAFSE